MNRGILISVAFTLLASSAAAAQTAAPTPAPTEFAPFQQWMGAVLTGDATTLKGLYSTSPAAQVRVQGSMHDADADISFWLGLKVKNMNVEFVRQVIRPERASMIFRATVVTGRPDGQTITVTDDQYWVKQGAQWRLAGIERTDSPQLKQPADMKKNIYPADADAHAEIKEAEEKAAKEHKRILLVFGANWCFDCHVLDLAFHGPELGPIVAANYELVRVDIGDDGKKNGDIAKQFDVPLDKGVPAMAVVGSDGKLVVSQKNGEVEDARRLTPQILAEFLNKWKPVS